MQVSTIVRHHSGLNALDLLREALTSLAGQTYRSIQVVVALQNASPLILERIASILAEIFGENIRGPDTGENELLRRIGNHRVVSVFVENGKDGRTRMLNAVLPYCEGRYLAFLDYDDILYPEAYAILLAVLQKTDAAVAVGGANVGLMRMKNSRYETYKTHPFLKEKRGVIDFFHQNFIPIHTFVLDKTRISPELLKFDERFTRAEDYVFLLKLALEHSFDFGNLMVPIAEYRFRDDGSNTAHHPLIDAQHAQKTAEWESQLIGITKLKSGIYARVNVLEIDKYSQELAYFRKLKRDYILLEYYIAPVKYAYRLYRYLRMKLNNLLGRS